MKKHILLFMIASSFVACTNSGTTKSTAADSGTSPNVTNVQNVNGNQPDTTQGIKLTQSATPDTSKKSDTMHH